MAVSKLSLASVRNGFAKSNTFWDQTTFAPVFDSIQTIVVGSGGASSVTFSGIPQSYQHLQVRVFARSTASAVTLQSLSISINGDTTSGNYYFHRLQGNGTAVSSDAYAGEREIMQLPAANALASVFSSGVIDILDYTSLNKNKTVRSLNGKDFNGNSSGLIVLQSELYMATPTAITSLTFSATLAQYSHFALYGIKGA